MDNITWSVTNFTHEKSEIRVDKNSKIPKLKNVIYRELNVSTSDHRSTSKNNYYRNSLFRI